MAPQERPTVTVVIPTFNQSGYLAEAIESVLGQTFQDIEVLVVDDGSTDETAAVVQRYADPRVQYLWQPNQGVSAARNFGIQRARGANVAFLDSDDLWFPTKLERQLTLLERFPDLGLVGGGCVFVDETGKPTGHVVRGPPVVTQQDLEIFAALPGMASNELIPRRVFDEVGLFDPTLKRSQDRELYLRISRSFPIRTVGQPTCMKRIHSTDRALPDPSVVRECRTRINETIEDRSSRRKAYAYMHYRLFRIEWRRGMYALAITDLVRSFLRSPGPISERARRLRGVGEVVLPKPLQDLAGAMIRPFRRR